MTARSSTTRSPSRAKSAVALKVKFSSTPDLSQYKIALVCDWLTNVGGAEKVLLSIHQLFPDAPIYTSQYNPKGIDWFKDADVRTGWLKIFPSKLRRILSPLRQRYFSHLDLSEYDIIISVTGAEAKSVKFRPDAKHFCYCHAPTQYYWQMYDDYVKNPGFGPFNFLVRPLFKLLVGKLRRADYAAAQLPSDFITISQYSADQIKKYYHRDSTIIPPPVAVENFAQIVEKSAKPVEKPVENSRKTDLEQSPASDHVRSRAPAHSICSQASSPAPIQLPNRYFLNFSRQVSWKRLDLAIKACQKTKTHLVLVGDGPEHSSLIKLAQASTVADDACASADGHIFFLPAAKQSQLKQYLRNADAFIFPSLEPFGIAPVEALSAGVPVIAYAEGGARDYIKDGKNGLLFQKQTVSSLASALEKFQNLPSSSFSPRQISQSAAYYSETRFQTEIEEFINAKIH